MSFVLTVSKDKVPVIAEVDKEKYLFDKKTDVWVDGDKLDSFFEECPIKFHNGYGLFYYSAAPPSKNPKIWIAQRPNIKELRKFIIKNNFGVH